MAKKNRVDAKKVTLWIPLDIHDWMTEEAEDMYTTLTGVAVRALRAAMNNQVTRQRDTRSARVTGLMTEGKL
jgi:hypothetical protein